MNTETGKIQYAALTDEEAQRQNLIKFREELMTLKQKMEMQVSLHDHRSALGKKLTEHRSKYRPHVGEKQRAKMEKRGQ